MLRNWNASSPESNGPIPAPDAALLAGIAAYRRHPSFRDVLDPPAIWHEGGSRLLDYGQHADDARPVLFVPSLINRAYVLDLLAQHSMLRFLAKGGIRPVLLDWGFPGAIERDFTLTDYIAGRLERAIASLGGKVTLAGYCMGGLMTVAAAQRRPDLVDRLVLLATPWDFHAADPIAARRLGSMVTWFEPALAMSGTLPVDALQLLFSLLEPGGVAAKYRDFGRQDQSSGRAAMFVAIEDWLNDGIPLAAPVAREALTQWYGSNAPMQGRWRVAGAPVLPEALSLPCFVAVPDRDRIVPPQSARPLAARIEGAVLHLPKSGHVGMVAGSGARRALWQTLLEWLRGGPI